MIKWIEKSIVKTVPKPEHFDKYLETYENLLEEFKNEEAALTKMIKDLEAADKAAADAVGNLAKATEAATGKAKTQIEVTTRGPVGFMGFGDAWKRMAENFSRTKEDIQKRMLNEQMEANVHLQGIEANTEFLREVGKATD